MKIFKFKTVLFSLMAFAIMTVFLSSCKKDSISSNTIDAATESSEINEDITHFTLPSKYDEMSDDELAKYIEENEIEESDLLKIAEEVSKDQLEERWCTYTVVYNECKYYPICSSYHRERLLIRRYCSNSGYYCYYTWGNCCL